jgi:hypothetical protein
LSSSLVIMSVFGSEKPSANPIGALSRREGQKHCRSGRFKGCRICISSCWGKPLEECVRFVEVAIVTPLNVCEERDYKGTYRKGREQKTATVQEPYESPLKPEIVVDTTLLNAPSAAQHIMDTLRGLESGGRCGHLGLLLILKMAKQSTKDFV